MQGKDDGSGERLASMGECLPPGLGYLWLILGTPPSPRALPQPPLKPYRRNG